MKSIDVKGTLRTETGKKSTRELRKAGSVPCVLYGVKTDEKGAQVATHFSVEVNGLRNLIYTPHIYVVNLTIDGQACKAILKDIQFDPVKDTILHVDFYEVTENKPIVMEVPIKLNGLAAGVRAGGKLQASVRKLKVKALYSAIPEKLNIDVTNLQLGKCIKTGDLSFEGLELVTPAEVVVCAVRLTRASRGAEAEA